MWLRQPSAHPSPNAIPLARPLDLAAQGSELRAGVVAHLALAVENPADLAHQRLRVGETGYRARELHARRIHGGDPRRRLTTRREQAGETENFAADERRVAALQPLDELRQALPEPRHQRRFETQPPDLLVARAAAAELIRLPCRLEGAQDRCSEVGARLGGEQSEKGVELERQPRRRSGDRGQRKGRRCGGIGGRGFHREKNRSGVRVSPAPLGRAPAYCARRRTADAA